MIITVTGVKGGIGKTTVAFNIACILKVYKIVELDCHDSISVILDMRESDDFTLYAPKTKAALIELIADFMGNENEHIIIDCGGYDSDVTQTAIGAADLVLTPTTETLKDLNGLRLFNDVLNVVSDDMGHDVKAFVFPYKNHHAKRRFDTLEAYTKQLNRVEYCHAPIATNEKVNESDLDGKAVSEMYPTSKPAKQFEELAKYIRATTGIL